MTNGTITTDKGDTFYDLAPLGNYAYLNRASIYTIWTGANEPNRYNLIYIGESGETGARLDSTHHKFQCWLNHAVNRLYVAFLWMPTSQYTKEQRLATEQSLIEKYNPVCNS